MLDNIDKSLLKEVASLHEIPQGAYNIRKNGEVLQETFAFFHFLKIDMSVIA